MSSIIEKALEKLEQDDATAALQQSGPIAPEQPANTESKAASPAAHTAMERGGPSVPPGRRGSAQDAPAGSTTEAGPGPRSRSDEVAIDLARLSAAGMVTPDNAATPIAEQHRIIKRPLLLKAFPSDGKRAGNENLIMVTSALPEEGKTFIAVNLAMSIAMEVDRTVLLVDADPAKSSVSRVLGLPAERGLTDYLLSDHLDLAQILVRTNIPNLVVLPSGRSLPNATELFSSNHMRRLADELANRYADRLVIFDSPPVLATSGARVLAHLAGQIVFVVEAVRTPQSAVREALRMLEPHPSLGMVLNKSRERSRAGYHYGYQYGYQYGET